MSFDWSTVINVDTLMAWILTSGVHVLAIAVGAFIVVRIFAFASRRVERFFEDDDPDVMSEREKQAATLGKTIRNLIRVAVWGVAAIMILKELGIEIGPILAAVGIVGLAVGFGAQSIVKDFLAGAFVLIENQYNVGDVIRVADVAGLVERVTLRATTLRDLEGRVHIIPNGSITVVTNMTKKWSRFVLDIGVAYKEDVDHVIQVLKEVGDEMAADAKYASMITAPVEVLGLEKFDDSAVVIRVMFTTQPIKQWTIGREYRRRVKKTFDAKGIEIPFPHRTVYVGEGSPMNGKLRVEVEQPSSGGSADAAPDAPREEL